MKDARRGKPVIDQLRHALPCESVSLAAPPKRSLPEVGHATSERRERPAIGLDRIVGEVASYYLAQPLSLFGYRLVHSTLQLYLDVLQRTPHAVASGRRQRGAAPASCARLQPQQFPAHAGDAEADQGLVTDDFEGQAKIGAKVVSHGRYVQRAEVAIPRQMFQEILRRIAELRPQPPPATA
jgi:hypothetical protein